MAVVVRILSGARRNDRITLDSRMFRAGSDPSCEVFFDPDRDTTVRGRSAKFCLQDGGWYLHCAGGEMYVNGKRVTGATHLRSGDKIRMSNAGPEFSFEIAAAVKASPVGAPELQAVLPQSSQEEAKAAPAQPQVAADSAAAPAAAQPNPVATPSLDRRDRQPIIWFAGGLAATLVALIVFRWVIGGAPERHTEPATGQQATTGSGGAQGQHGEQRVGGGVGTGSQRPAPTVAPDKDKVEGAVGKIVESTGKYGSQSGGAVTITASPGQVEQDNAAHTWRWSYTPDSPGIKTVTITAQGEGEAKGTGTFDLVVKSVEQSLGDNLKDVVYLIVVEDAGRYWAFATCVAVGGDTLLTTAREAAVLAKWQGEKRFKIWVTRPAGNLDVKKEVQQIRVLAPFTVLSEESNDRFFLDVGLLTVGGTLSTAEMASSKELEQVKEGSHVLCFGFPAEGRISANDKIEPRLVDSKVFLIEVGERLPGKPSLLQVQGELPTNAYGSPVVTKTGRVVGLYSEAIAESKGVKNLHYVTVVDPQLIDRWLRDRDKAEMWVPPLPAPTSEKTTPPSKP